MQGETRSRRARGKTFRLLSFTHTHTHVTRALGFVRPRGGKDDQARGLVHGPGDEHVERRGRVAASGKLRQRRPLQPASRLRHEGQGARSRT